MKKRLYLPIALAFTIVLALSGVSYAQVKVIMSGGFSAAFEETLPDFQKTTGIVVMTTRGQSQGNTPDAIGAQLRRGVPADVVIMSREGLDELIAEGRIAAGTDVDLAQTPLGMSVRVGAPKPDISTVENFKRTLLHAKSVTFPSSTTGIYMVNKLFPELGIAKEMAMKSTNTGVAAVANGDAEIALQPMSELLHVPGAAFVGTIPSRIQYISVFSAAIVAGSKEIKASSQLIAWLASDKAKTAIRNSGMEPHSTR